MTSGKGVRVSLSTSAQIPSGAIATTRTRVTRSGR